MQIAALCKAEMFFPKLSHIWENFKDESYLLTKYLALQISILELYFKAFDFITNRLEVSTLTVTLSKDHSMVSRSSACI